MLLGTFVNEVWWPSCGKLRECTRVGYESAYRCHIQPKWADVDMESITANDIEEWLGSFNQAGAARKAWAVLRAILRLAYRKGVTDNDVTRREIRLPHLRRYEPRVLDARQVRRLLKGFYGHALEAWLLVSVCAGLRRCESVGIDDESFPCPLQTSQHGQIGAEIVAGGCLDVAVTELSCDH